MDEDRKAQSSHLVYISFTGQESNKIFLFINIACCSTTASAPGCT